MDDQLQEVDVALIGAGIMGATLASLLAVLEPSWNVAVFERLGAAANESSNGWHNAGTGHSALCELNYTSRTASGAIDVSKAVGINEQFQVSREYWASLVRSGALGLPHTFINPVPHMSFVRGNERVAFLRDRHAALIENPLFEGMEFSDDPAQLDAWIPLVMEGRDPAEHVAATRATAGSDVDFGALTRQLLEHAQSVGTPVLYNTHVSSVDRADDGRWVVSTVDQLTGSRSNVRAKFVFIGAGGGALHLLQRSGIPQAKGFGGFPISGKFLRCTNQALIERHDAKVYGEAAVGAPPMSVPHLDSRFVGGKRSLLFGPYAGFSPKFLRHGSIVDLPASVRPGNIVPMLTVAKNNTNLISYLVGEVAASREHQLDVLRDYLPEAKADDWEMVTAGQRVQVIKKRHGKGGILQFGTEIVSSKDGSIAGLLGASPGASTAVSIMLGVLAKCFRERMPEWRGTLEELIPSFGTKLSRDPTLAKSVMAESAIVLGLSQ